MDMSWTDEELKTLAESDELTLQTSKSVIIWMVSLGERLFVRSVNGRGSRWFRNAQAQQTGRITAGKLGKEVRLLEGGQDLQPAIDAAFRAKYGRYARLIVDSTVSPQAQSATLELIPQDKNEGA